jgi:hypothetical protein
MSLSTFAISDRISVVFSISVMVPSYSSILKLIFSVPATTLKHLPTSPASAASIAAFKALEG